MLTLFGDAIDDATKIIDGITAEDFHRPTPCSGWDLGQLLSHMIGEIDGFTEAVTTGSAAADRFVREPVTTQAAMPEWNRASTALLEAFTAADPEAIIGLSDYGPLPVRVALGMQLLDTAVHSWDVASALGSSYRPGEQTVASINEFAHRIAARGDTGPAFRPPVGEPADGSDPWEQALRLLGRDPSRPLPSGHLEPTA